MPKAIASAAATSEDPAVQEYYRTLRAVGTQSMRELDKLDHEAIRKKAEEKVRSGSAASRKPPPVIEEPDEADERRSVH